ncbi:PREDICTED: protein toll-like [Polistes dominula]|uniref:Protein toll-like n=1 Tax=Polistes dominula TaxID=743375 RepID=A0ABM1JB20_POLDO|nr:PREDICTED: protein toll-like [Polistes dominula]
MGTIIFVVIFLIFTNIVADNPECEKESFCECSKNENNTYAYYVSNKGVKFGINVKSFLTSQIKCENVSWKDFDFTKEQNIYKVDSVDFENCLLPEETTLKDIVNKLGMIEIHRLSFQSHKNLSKSLTTEHFQGFSNVIELVLSYNGLTNIPSDFFIIFPYLTSLDLSENSLVLSQNTFNIAWNLQKLDLHGNGITELPFDNKENLTSLHDVFITDLKNLEEVHMRNNKLKFIPDKFFTGTTSVKFIDWSENIFEEIKETTFVDVFNTIYLNISHNRIKELPDLVFQYFQNLEVLDLSYNRLDNIQRKLFYGLTSLKELNMEGNILYHIHSEAFSTNEQLSVAKFSDNHLDFDTTLNMMSPFFNNHLLKELHLSNNTIKHFYSDWTTNKLELELLDLRHNDISTISANYFVFSSDNLLVDLRYNNIKNILLANIEKLALYNTEKRNVTVHVENNPLICDCHLYNLVRYSNGDMPVTVYNLFELRFGNLTCVYPDGIQKAQINQLDFQTYHCLEKDYFKIVDKHPNLCTSNIRPYDKRRVIDCSYKLMFELKINKNTINLKGNYPLILNLTGNYLREIPSLHYLKPLNSVHLLLSNNEISKISLDRLTNNIQVLELHNNHLVKLNYDIIFYWYVHSYKKLTLSGNPFKCDCDATVFIKFVLNTQDSYEDLKNVKCQGYVTPLAKMSDYDYLILCFKKYTEKII